VKITLGDGRKRGPAKKGDLIVFIIKKNKEKHNGLTNPSYGREW